MSILKNAKLSSYKGLYTKEKNDDVQYIARFKTNNKSFTKIIGLKSEGISLDEAYKIKLNIEHEQKLKTSKTINTDYEFSILFQYFIDFRSPYLAQNTNKNYKSHLNKYFNFDFAGTDVRNLSQTDMQRYINKKLEILRPATVEKILYSLRAFYKYLISHGYVKYDPTVYVHMPKFDNKKYFSLPKKEVAKLVNYIMNIDNQFIKTLYIFLLHGRRINEVLTLKYEDIDFLNKTYTINYSLSKNRKNQVFPLEEWQLEEVLKLKYLEPYNRYLFENKQTNKPITYTSIFRVHKKLRADLNLPTLTLHSFRHLVGFLMINDGHSLEITAKVLGHQNIQSTQRYANLKMDKPKKAYSDVISAYL